MWLLQKILQILMKKDEEHHFMMISGVHKAEKASFREYYLRGRSLIMR